MKESTCTARAFGAATIINAIATGKGAAFGIGLETRATVSLNDSGEFTASIGDHPEEDTLLIRLCARRVLETLGIEKGAKIRTESNIPIAAGLKSSSTAANAVALATRGAAKELIAEADLDGSKLLEISVDSAIEANVTITGAFDDAAASFYGGFVVTDNSNREILRRGKMDPGLEVLIHLPQERLYTAEVDVGRTKLVSREVKVAWGEALSGDLYTAMNLNGILYSSVLGFDSQIALSALENGAVAAGLSGKGPAVVALSGDPSVTDKVLEGWEQFEGDTIKTRINNAESSVC